MTMTLEAAQILLADAVPDETLLTYGERYDILGSGKDFDFLVGMLLDLILRDVNTRDMLTIFADEAVDRLSMADRTTIGDVFIARIVWRYLNNDVLQED